MSMINRHNYEEFFLLYADGELNSQQRTAVELFAKQNPDLVAELDMFMQMRLEPEEDIVFSGKEALYKKTDVEININNYEEFFYLYIDRELGETERGKVEKFVLQHPQLQDEFTLLKQTILPPETIVFENKSALYRQEESKRVIPLFIRYAVAAAIIGIAVLGWWLYTPGTVHPGTGDGIVKTEPKKQSPVITGPEPLKQQPVAPLQQGTQQSTAAVNNVRQQPRQVVQPIQNADNKIQQSIPQQQPVVNTPGNDIAVNDNKHDKEPPAIAQQTTVPVITGDNPVIANVDMHPVRPVDIIGAGTDEQKGNEYATATLSGPNVGTTYNIPYKVIDTNDEDRSMYIGALELNKDKVKGFLKRAGRIFGGKGKKQAE